MQKLKEINIGVASKNFGYLGFKSLIDGLKTQTEVETLSLRCGVNRVGINGAEIVNKMLAEMDNLKHLTIGFVENYIGDDGLSSLSQNIAENLPNLKTLILDVSFNDAKGFGGIAALKHLSSKPLEHLDLRMSNNEFRDYDIKLMKPHLKQLIKNNKIFVFDFMDTAISRVMMDDLTKLFEKHGEGYSEIAVNSIIPEEEQQKAEQAAGIKTTEKPKTEQNQ